MTVPGLSSEVLLSGDTTRWFAVASRGEEDRIETRYYFSPVEIKPKPRGVAMQHAPTVEFTDLFRTTGYVHIYTKR